MKNIKYALTAVSLAIGLAAGTFSMTAAAEPTLSKADFEDAQLHYFQRCAGCHGVLRKGATGKNLEPKNTLKKGQKRLEKIISLGTEGGMNNFDDIFSKKEISNLATFIQMTPPVPPEMSITQMRAHTKQFVALKDYPSKPQHNLNWNNFFIVIERDAGTVAIIDGDTKKIITHINTGYAVHVIKGTEHHNTQHVKDLGRFWYTSGRDGKVTKIDLWQTPEKMLVAETKMAYDARDIAVSGDGKYVIAGGYWPAHFVIMDAETLNPLKVVSTRGYNTKGEFVNEARVAAIYTTPNEPTFMVAVKELGQMWQVDYTDLDNLNITHIDSDSKSTMYTPLFSYKPVDSDRDYTFSSAVSSSSPSYSVGEKVDLLYDTREPSRVHEDNPMENYIKTLGLLLVAFIFLVLGMFYYKSKE